MSSGIVVLFALRHPFLLCIVDETDCFMGQNGEDVKGQYQEELS